MNEIIKCVLKELGVVADIHYATSYKLKTIIFLQFISC